MKYLGVIMALLLNAGHAEISKEVLFSTPLVTSMKIAPRGDMLTYVGADKHNIPNVFVTNGLSLENPRQITHFDAPDIIQFFWSAKGDKVLLLKDEDGKNQLNLYGIDVHSGATKIYTKQFEQINTKVIHISSKENKAVIGLNNRNPKFHDLYVLHLDSGELTLLFENDVYAKFLVSDDLDVVLKMKINGDGSWAVYDRKDRVFMELTAEEAFQTEFLRYDSKRECVYFLDNRSTDTNQLMVKSLKGDETVLGHQEESDVSDVLFVGGEPKAYASYYTRKKWHTIDDAIGKDIQRLGEHFGDDFQVLSQTADGKVWVVLTQLPDQGARYWLYTRETRAISHLYSRYQGDEFAKMYPLVVTARDGQKLVCYYTLPREYDQEGAVKSPIPLVVVPHGGPFKVRDTYGFNPWHQWLASRGYAVLSVNFRLSSGFGKAFVNAGNGQWGGIAHLDVVDGVQACIEKGITAHGKTAILGGSYGGYEALASLTFSPDFFTCGVAICGPSNLKTVLGKVPEFWEFTPSALSDAMMFFTKQAFITSMGGDPDDEKGAAYLEKCSPLNYAGSIQRPLLLIHGCNDHIVNEGESRQIYDEVIRNGKTATYIAFPDEGHRIAKFPNKLFFLDQSEKFLSEHLGGKYHPVAQETLKQSSAEVF